MKKNAYSLNIIGIVTYVNQVLLNKTYNTEVTIYLCHSSQGVGKTLLSI